MAGQVQVNGGHVSSFGGVIQFANTMVGADLNTYTGYVGWSFLDVAKWSIDLTMENKDLKCGGQLGSTTSRNIGYNYPVKFDVVWDYRYHPDVLLAAINGFAGFFLLGGQKEAWDILDERIQFYWSPCLAIDKCTPVVDPASKKMIRMSIEAHSRTHFILCPERGKIDDITTVAGAYYRAFVTGKVIK